MSESVGEQLLAARQARGWSLEDVAVRLKIPARYVSALERNDATVLPEATFVRGYVKAYAKALGLDADALLAVMLPVEVKAPRPLIGPEGQVGSVRRAGAVSRGPSFRAASTRRYPVVVAILLAGAATWLFWPKTDPAGTQAVSVAPLTPAAPAAPAVTLAVPASSGGVTLEVPLPGGAAQPVVPSQPAATAVAPPVALPAKPAAAAVALPTATATPASGAAVAAAAPASEASPVVAPRKGLHARFSGTCWIEVRDADNVVIHTRIAMAGNEINVEGKAPLTVTLGDASAVELWYNGDRVAADKFSSNGIARIIVGQIAR